MKKPLRILIIRMDGLGDTLLTLPLVSGLQSSLPDCRITFLASPRGAPVLKSDNRIADLWIQEPEEMTHQQKGDLLTRIKESSFDIVFCLNEKLWPALWTLGSGAKIRLGFIPGWLQPTKTALRKYALTDYVLTDNNPFNPSIHEVQRYAQLAGLLQNYDLFSSIEADGPIHLQWQHSNRKRFIHQRPLEPRLYIALHLSAKWTSEGWDSGVCVRLAKSILQQNPTAFLFITGTTGDEQYFSTTDSSLAPNQFSLQTNLSFDNWADLFASCHAIITMDTGAAHLAAAVGTPVIDIFPAQHFLHTSSRWAPWKVPHQIIQRPLPTEETDFFSKIHHSLKKLLKTP